LAFKSILFDHENYKVHRVCLGKWYELKLQLHIHQEVDKGMQVVMDKEQGRRQLGGSGARPPFHVWPPGC